MFQKILFFLSISLNPAVSSLYVAGFIQHTGIRKTSHARMGYKFWQWNC
ncbi:hypothetical protein LptCag_1082 [Leptospirillum ferriphilum]|uniref:Uncharacterized protein n=1 Tax=Leptospirillum ferriphilum TaxID=178606 RepID=A0A094X6Z0_9BACT|nr:hypothetical protein LptCag_1082 [Leptospirillum ferriphilum]